MTGCGWSGRNRRWSLAKVSHANRRRLWSSHADRETETFETSSLCQDVLLHCSKSQHNSARKSPERIPREPLGPFSQAAVPVDEQCRRPARVKELHASDLQRKFRWRSQVAHGIFFQGSSKRNYAGTCSRPSSPSEVISTLCIGFCSQLLWWTLAVLSSATEPHSLFWIEHVQKRMNYHPRLAEARKAKLKAANGRLLRAAGSAPFSTWCRGVLRPGASVGQV